MTNSEGLTDREAAIDALTRFVCALDEGDPDLLRSSITEDMLMDLSPFDKIGRSYSSFSGKETVVERLMKVVGQSMDSTHMITNIRTKGSGDSLEIACYALAQHYRLGQGPSPDFQDFYLMGNKYKAQVVRDGDVWRVKSLRVEPAWTQGVPGVMKV